MDYVTFLSNFELLAENDEKTQNSAIKNVTDTIKTQLAPQNGASEENSSIPACMGRTFKFQFFGTGDSLVAQYAVDRLIKGLTSNRNYARNGFSRALLAVLHATTPHVDLVQVRAAIDHVTNTDGCAKNELRDALCGRLHGYFILDRLGFFSTTRALADIGDVFKSIWEVYDSKIYFQDAACWLIYLLTKNYHENFEDPSPVLRLLSARLERLFDPGFVEKASSLEGGLVNDVGNDFDTFGKSFSGILPCPLFGLYIKVNQLFMSLTNASIRNDASFQWLNKCLLLDPSLVSLSLRYIVTCPKYYPFIGWFLEAFVDLILSQHDPEPLMTQLWQSIVLNLLSGDSTSTRRQVVGLDLCARILKASRTNIKVTINLLLVSGPFIKLLESYLGAKGNKSAAFTSVASSSRGKERFSGFLRCLIQSEAFTPGGDDFDILKDSVASYGAASVDNYRLFKELSDEYILKGVAISRGAAAGSTTLGSGTLGFRGGALDSLNLRLGAAASQDVNKGASAPSILNANATTTAIANYPASDACDAIHAIFAALDYSKNPFTTQFLRDFVAATDHFAFFKALESKICNLELTQSFGQIKWIFSMLEACLANCHRRDLLQMFERFATLSTCWIPFANGDLQNRIYINVAMVESTGLGPFIIVSPSPIFPKASSQHPKSGVNLVDLKEKCVQLNCHLSMAIASWFVKLQHFNVSKASQFADEYITCDELIVLCERLYWRLSRHGFNGSYKARPSANGACLLLSESVGTLEVTLHAKDASLGSKELIKACKRARLRLEFGGDGPLLCCGYIMAVAALLIEREPSHLKTISFGLVRTRKELGVLVPGPIGRFFDGFTRTLVEGFTDVADFAQVRKRMACGGLLDAIFLDDETPLSALLHSVAKRLWSLLGGDLPADVVRSVLRQVLLQCGLVRVESEDDHLDGSISDLYSESISDGVEESDSDGESGDGDEFEFEFASASDGIPPGRSPPDSLKSSARHRGPSLAGSIGDGVLTGFRGGALENSKRCDATTTSRVTRVTRATRATRATGTTAAATTAAALAGATANAPASATVDPATPLLSASAQFIDDSELDSPPSREPIDRDCGIGKSVSSGIKRKFTTPPEGSNDIFLTPAMALEHLGGEDGDEENAKRQRRMLSRLRRANRGLDDFDSEALDHKIRCGELLLVYFASVRTFGPCHLQAANALYRSLLRATMVMSRPKLEPKILNYLHVYTAKLQKILLVLSKSIKRAAAVDVNFCSAHEEILNDTCNQIVNSHCCRLTSTPRLQHAAGVLFALCYAIESQWPGACVFNSRVVAHLKVGFVAMAKGRVCEFRVDFIRHLSNLCPRVLWCINYVKLALATSVQFKQSLFLTFCALVLKSGDFGGESGASKDDTLREFTAKIDVELGSVCKGVSAEDLASGDFYTCNLLGQSAEGLLLLLDRLRGSLGAENEGNGDDSKRQKCAVSCQLLKAVAALWLLLTSRCSVETCADLHERLGLLAARLKDFKGSARQLNILEAAIAKAKASGPKSVGEKCAAG